MALAMLPRFGGRLGDALVGIGVLRPIELFRAVHDQTQERLVQVFQWKRGEMAFARGVRSQEETFPLGVDTYELIGRGIRHGYGFAELEAMLAPVREEVLEPVAAPPVRLEMFRLPEREAGVVEAVTGKTTLSKLVAAADRPRVWPTPRRCCAPCSWGSPASCCAAPSGSCRRASSRRNEAQVVSARWSGGRVNLGVRDQASHHGRRAHRGGCGRGGRLLGIGGGRRGRPASHDLARLGVRAGARLLSLSSGLARRMSAAVGELTAAARRMTEGDLSVRTRLPGETSSPSSGRPRPPGRQPVDDARRAARRARPARAASSRRCRRGSSWSTATAASCS